MKKLMMAAAVALVAIGAQASACKWTASNILDPSDGTTALSGVAVWVFYDTDTTSWSGAKTLAYATAEAYVADLANSEKKAAALSSLEAGAFKTGTTTGTGQINIVDTRTGAKNWAAGNSVAGYAVIFDNADVSKAEHAIITSLPSAQNFTGTNQTKTFALGSQASATWNTVYNTADVPEPTSGLLMLLGVAGLALRRRRA